MNKGVLLCTHRHGVWSKAIPLCYLGWFGRCCGPEAVLHLMLLQEEKGEGKGWQGSSGCPFCLWMLLEIQYMSQYVDIPWANSEESEQKVIKLLGNQFQSCFPFLFKEHKLFSPEDKNQYLSKNWASYCPYQRSQTNVARGKVETLRQMLPHFQSVKAAEGSWENKAPLSLGLPVGIVFPFSHMS